MNLYSLIKQLVPMKYRLPISYYVHKLRGTLEPEMDLLQDFVGNGQRAIDIGANVGIYTYALSKLYNYVEAFDPVPEYCELLHKSQFDNVTIHNIGLSDHSGLMHIHIPSRGIYGESASFLDLGFDNVKLEVEVRTLDEYQFSDVSFIKIDVEGYEAVVIDGAKQTIINNKPIMLVEIEQRHITTQITSVINKITELGYDGYFYKDKKLHDIALFNYEVDQKPFANNLKGKNHIYNFIFKPV